MINTAYGTISYGRRLRFRSTLASFGLLDPFSPFDPFSWPDFTSVLCSTLVSVVSGSFCVLLVFYQIIHQSKYRTKLKCNTKVWYDSYGMSHTVWVIKNIPLSSVHFGTAIFSFFSKFFLWANHVCWNKMFPYASKLMLLTIQEPNQLFHQCLTNIEN